MSYFQHKAISNSALSYINPEQEGSPQKFKRFQDGHLSDEGSPSLERGDLIHKMMLEPEKYELMSISKPSEVICGIIESIAAGAGNGGELNDYRTEIEALSFEANYQPNWKAATRIDKIIEQGSEYFMHLVRQDGKVYLDHSTNNCVQQCIMALRQNEKANALLSQESDAIYSTYQELEIYWEMKVGDEMVSCKAKLDKLLINQKTKKFNIVDLKTTSKHVCRYPESFSFWHTYRQLAYYETAVLAWLESQGITGYQPGNHYVVSVMTKEPYLTRVFKISRAWIEKGHLEYMSLHKRIQYHRQTGDWVFEQEHHLQNGIFDLEIPALFSLSALTAAASN